MDLIGEANDAEPSVSVIELLENALRCLQEGRIEVTVADQVRWKPGRSVQEHRHDDLFHLDLFDGTGSVILENRSLPLRNVTLIMIPPGWSHAFTSSPNAVMRNRTVKFRLLGSPFPPNVPYMYLPQPDESLLRRVADGLAWNFEEWQMRQEGWEGVCGGILGNLTALMLRAGIRLHGPQPHGVLEEACYIMAMQCSQSLSIRDVAARCGVRPDALSRLFRAHLGVSPREYLQSIRLKQARSLLAGGFTVTEVSEQTGFSSVHYFSRVFSRIFGLPPSRCRPGHRTVE
ncbi:MAG: helix-turn-helix domain-containing protein [Phycisphaerae bacterium]|nr:helix-turn-helix domain-containing protein [Phycisphaerae bacterium]